MSRSFVLCLCALAYASSLFAHPMGNFSVSHYSKLVVTAQGVELEYALDLAEIPTFELLRAWNLERRSPQSDLDNKASEQASKWLANLAITVDGRPVKPTLEHVRLAVADGAGNLPVMRITAQARINAQGAKLGYEDRNYPERAGWKEIVIDTKPGAALKHASQSSKDISKGLTQYPPDPTVAPPQDLRAEVEWTAERPLLLAQKAHPKKETVPPVVAPISQPKLAPRADAPALLTAQAAPQGAVTRGDFLSKILHQQELTPSMIFLALIAAFALGAAHALTPGHGKTIVAAYLVGSRGTLKHAAFLGAMVTFTHTVTVFALGLATLFLFRYIVPEKITQALGVISGLFIVVIGAWMLRKRLRGHSHSHTHAHHHHHEAHDHGHAHSHDHHHHHDHGHAHSHVPDEISWGGLAALGASGGLVPCESALVLLLGAIALGRVGLGLLLLISFSLGLALVLMAIGALVLYAKNLIPERKRSGAHPLFHWVSVASPAIVMIVGLLMTGVSLGWIQPKWAIG
jgi:nickel/cobalt exporter